MSAEKLSAAMIKFVGGVEKAIEDGWKPGEKIPSWLETRVAEVGEAVLGADFTPAETDTPNNPPVESVDNSDEDSSNEGEDQSPDEANASL